MNFEEYSYDNEFEYLLNYYCEDDWDDYYDAVFALTSKYGDVYILVESPEEAADVLREDLETISKYWRMYCLYTMCEEEISRRFGVEPSPFPVPKYLLQMNGWFDDDSDDENNGIEKDLYFANSIANLMLAE